MPDKPNGGANAPQGEPAAPSEPNTPAQQPAGQADPAPQPTPEPTKQEDPGKPATEPGKGEASEGAALDPAAFKMPEGVELDTKAAEAFAPIAGDLNLNQEQAQKLVDFYAKQQADAAKGQMDTWEKQQDEWQAAVKADEEIGGVDFEEKIGTAKKALDKFGTPELIDAVNATGLGNHPELVRFAYRVGKAMSEDTIGAGGTQGGESTLDPEAARAKRLFPNHK